MSYSFSIVAASLAMASTAVAVELDNVLESQPIHAADREQAEAAANAFIDLLEEPGENEEVVVNVSGSVSRPADAEKFTHASVSVNAYVRQKLAQQE